MNDQNIDSEQNAEELVEKDNKLDVLAKRIAGIENSLFELKELFQGKIEKDQSKAELITIINRKLEKYERDFVFKEFKERIFLDLIRFVDRIDTMLLSLTDTTDAFEENLRSLQDEIVLQVLKRQGVELIEEKPDKFNDEFQEAIATEVTSNPEDDNTVIRVEKKGFRYQERLLRPQMVVVYKYET